MSCSPRATEAPRKVFMVRWPSGVTRIRQRAVGAPPWRGAVGKWTPMDFMSAAKVSPSVSWATLPM